MGARKPKSLNINGIASQIWLRSPIPEGGEP